MQTIPTATTARRRAPEPPCCRPYGERELWAPATRNMIPVMSRSSIEAWSTLQDRERRRDQAIASSSGHRAARPWATSRSASLNSVVARAHGSSELRDRIPGRRALTPRPRRFGRTLALASARMAAPQTSRVHAAAPCGDPRAARGPARVPRPGGARRGASPSSRGEMGAPGFWDDQETRGEGQRRARARVAPARDLAGARARRRRPRARSPSSPRRTRRSPARSRSSSPAIEARLGRARGGAAVLRPLRRGRRARHRQRRRRRHRRAGLGRDGAADADALGRAARLRGRAARGEPGGGGRHQVGDLPRRGRERLRPVLAPRRASTGSCGCRRSTPPTAARRRSPASRSRRSSTRSATSRSTTTTCRSTPTARPAPAASTSTRPTPPCASRTARAGSSCSARTSARSRPTSDTAMKMLRAKLLELEERKRARGDRQGEGRGAGRQLRLADPLLRPAPVHDGQGPPHELRDGRRPARARRRPRRLRPRRAAARRSATQPRRDASEQPTAPYLDAVAGYGFRGSGRFHVPGHKGGPGADPGLRRALGEPALAIDIPQDIHGIDIGPSPTPYERAEQLAAEAYGARRSWFLTNGATQGNHALCLALAPLGATVVAQRNSHASLVDGLVLSGGLPAFVAPEYDPELGMAHGVTPRGARPRRSRAAPRGARGVHRLADLLRHGRRRRRLRARSRTTPACRSSSTSRGGRTSASTRRCRRARSRSAPTPC